MRVKRRATGTSQSGRSLAGAADLSRGRRRHLRIRPVVQLTAVAALIVMLPRPGLTACKISAVRFWTAPDHTRIVVDLSEEPRYSARVLVDPDRVVVDIAGGEVAAASRTTPIGDGLVERVRLNQLTRGAQVVADLVCASPHKVFALRPYSSKPNRVVIDVFAPESQTIPRERTADGEIALTGTRVVVIDPGHGGEDPGTLGNGEITEKDVVLDIGRRLASILGPRPGYEVHLTRGGDYFVALGKRKDLARSCEGNLFISIHANSSPNRHASGSEVYFVSPRGASDQAARELADRENAADLVGGVSPDTDGDLLSILVDLKMSDSVQKSSDLASMVADELSASGTSACVAKQAGFVVLKSLAMPSVLVEVGFLSNSSDVAKLKRESHRQAYAECLATAVDAFFERYAPAIAADGYHEVAPGETLWSIARRYNVTVSRLRELNSLADDSTVQVGQLLAVRETEGKSM